MVNSKRSFSSLELSLEFIFVFPFSPFENRFQLVNEQSLIKLNSVCSVFLLFSVRSFAHVSFPLFKFQLQFWSENHFVILYQILTYETIFYSISNLYFYHILNHFLTQQNSKCFSAERTVTIIFLFFLFCHVKIAYIIS